MFLRFIKLLTIIFLVFTILTFAVIVPINAVGIKTELEGLERISWTNLVDPREQTRFSAHIIVVYILTAVVLYMIYRELKYFVHLRHEFLLSKSHMKLPQSRTVLVTAIPDELSTEHDLRTFASFVPGGVDKVWMYRDSRELNELFEQRQEACQRLETAASTILVQATAAWRKKVKLHNKSHRKRKDEENAEAFELVKPEPSMDLLNELVPVAQRPRHRTGLLGLAGSNVETIEWCKNEIARLNEAIKEKRKEQVEGKFMGSAFIRCNLQMGAHILSQCLSYHEPMRMYKKWLEAHPKDIVWNNLDDVWAFPVTFIGTLSNLSELCTDVKWLAWVCNAPKIVQGIIEGVLPPVLLAALFIVLPFILQALAWYECIPRYSLISVSVYRRFYFFLLVHGFLIVTLSSGITNAISDIIQKPTQTVQELASKLPGASVFFLTYMVTQGLAGAGGALVQLAPLVLHFVKKWFLGRTPRQAYEVTFMMPAADFGVILPRLSLLATITFAYSVLSPLINLLAFISSSLSIPDMAVSKLEFSGFAMFYIAWKFLLVQVFDQPDEKETGGAYFPMAVNNLFVGLYIEHLCLACLFFLKAHEEGAGAIVKAVFMLVLLAITAFAHIFISHCFNPLSHYLPMSLATKKMAKKLKKEKQLREGVDAKDSDDEEFDLFSRDRIKSVRRRIKKQVNEKILPVISGDSDAAKHDRKGKDAVVVTAVPDNVFDGTAQITRQDTKESKASKKSRVSFDAAAPRVTASDVDSMCNDEDQEDEHAFDHPSTYQEQPWIWIPKDVLGLSNILAEELRGAGVEASDVGALMDEKGVVEVRRNPPDEEWAGGHDA
ncbi:hypothetical protein EST38_g10427 [Candolleomyces aberdarensis]|uniref:DUF221-domain-containing protein n=1 Tax=Candolleomyces aberdarensis TaxID=2316362 RepID=A0A4Q2D907_9AGAR|nr:hypothetical protein EST38_g10427 [Candolleomyces aberdarensis]